MNYKTIEEIGKDWEEGKYEADRPIMKKVSSDHVFDEDMSVKWNREEVLKHNTAVENEKENYKQKCSELNKKRYEETITAIMKEGFNRKQAELIEVQVSAKDHCPYSNYFIDLYDEMEYVANVMSAK